MTTTYFCSNCDRALPTRLRALYTAESVSEHSDGAETDGNLLSFLLCPDCASRLSAAERSDLARRREATLAALHDLETHADSLLDLQWASDPFLRAKASQLAAFHAAFRAQAQRAAVGLRDVSSMIAALPAASREGCGTPWLAGLGAVVDAYEAYIAESVAASERLERRSRPPADASEPPA